MKPQTITISAVRVATDPRTVVFQIEINDGTGVWCEVCNSPEQLRWFLRGIRVATCTAGQTMLPDRVWTFTEKSIFKGFDETVLDATWALALFS